MGNTNDPRHFARWNALQKLFNIDFIESSPSDGTSVFDDAHLNEINEVKKFDTGLSEVIIEGVLKSKEQINSIISQLAPERPIEQISKIDLHILYIAIYEGFIGCITPQKVVIDEAIELAKEFGTDSDRKFVSGVLGNLIQNKKVIKN